MISKNRFNNTRPRPFSQVQKWQWITDYIPCMDEEDNHLVGFKRYKEHRFNKDKTKIVFFDENKKPLIDRCGYLPSSEIKTIYNAYEI